LSNRYAQIILLSVFLYFCCGTDLSAQISVSPASPKDDISAADDYLKRNLKTVRSLRRVGNFERAKSLLLSLEKTYGRIPVIMKELKDVYRGQKDYVSLKSFILQELDTTPDSFSLVCQLGEVYFLADSLDMADSTWERAFRLAGRSERNYILLAGYYRGYGFYDEAAYVYRRAKIALGKPELFSKELSDIYVTQRNYKEAVAEYLNLLKFKTEKTRYISREIIEMVSESDYPEEIEMILVQAVRTDPDNLELYLILGDINVYNKNLIGAFESYKHADRLSDSKGMYINVFISLCYNSNEYEMTVQAVNYYLENIRGKNTAEIELLKAQSLAEMGIYQPAFDILSRISESSKNYKLKMGAVYIAGEIYADRLNDIESAKEQFSRIADNKRRSGFTYPAMIRLAELNIMEGDFTSASGLLDKLITVKKDNDIVETAIFLQAEIAFFSYDFKKAKKEYTNLIKRHPAGFFVNDCLDRQILLTDMEEDTVLYDIADAERCARSGDYEGAIIALRFAAERNNPKASEYISFNLAYYYSKAGLWDMAVTTYENYISNFPEGQYTDRSLYNLAEIYNEKNSQPGKANELLEKLIADFPASPLIEKARLYLNTIKSS